MAVTRLVNEGFGRQVLLSQDVCNKTYLCRYGGFGYGHILRDLTTNLIEAGLTLEEIRQITVDNPRKLLERQTIPVSDLTRQPANNDQQGAN